MALLSELATLYAPYESGIKVPATGISINGQDLSDLFAPASTGAATAPATGFLVSGADVSTLFAAIGTTAKLLDAWSGFYSDGAYANVEVFASVSLGFGTNNKFSGAGRSGLYLALGFSSSDYEIQAVLKSGDPLSANNMGSFVPIDANRFIALTASASPGRSSFKQAVVDITIRSITDNSISLTREVILSVSAESWGREGFLIPR